MKVRVVEVNPVLDVCNQTAQMAVEIAARLPGRKIYTREIRKSFEFPCSKITVSVNLR